MKKSPTEAFVHETHKQDERLTIREEERWENNGIQVEVHISERCTGTDHNGKTLINGLRDWMMRSNKIVSSGKHEKSLKCLHCSYQ